MGFQGDANSKEPACQCRRHERCGFDPWVRKILWRRAWQNPLQYSYLENPHGQRSLEGYSPWGCKESDTTERLRTAQYRLHFTCKEFSRSVGLAFNPQNWTIFLYLAQKLTMGTEALFFLTFTPMGLVPRSPELDDIGKKLGKLQAPKALSNFPVKKVPWNK